MTDPGSQSHGRRFAAAVLMLLAIAGCHRSAGKGPAYEYATVARGNLQQHVTASGSLSAVVSVDVGSQVSGKITHLYVDFNSPVHKGQLVAEIDPTVYEAQLQQAQGDLASARADVTLKGQNLQRKKILVPLKAASQLDLDQAVAELAQAQATVTIKEAALHSAQANLGYCKITAPVDGIVIARKVDEGQTVIAAMSTPVLFTVAQDITKMNITADISEADIGQVKTGQDVEFGVDAFPNEVFHGKVAQVRKSPTTTQNVVTYQTIIAVNNPEQKLFPGMTADVSDPGPAARGGAQGPQRGPALLATGEREVQRGPAPAAGACAAARLRAAAGQRDARAAGGAHRRHRWHRNGDHRRPRCGAARGHRDRGQRYHRRSAVRSVQRRPAAADVKAAPVSHTVISLRDITKVYVTGEVEVRAVARRHLDIQHGEFVAMMGASGSGKSTLMNILGCLDRPTERPVPPR